MGHRTPAAESAKRPCMNESISTESRSPPRFQAGRKADSRGRMISRPLALEIGSCEDYRPQWQWRVRLRVWFCEFNVCGPTIQSDLAFACNEGAVCGCAPDAALPRRPTDHARPRAPAHGKVHFDQEAFGSFKRSPDVVHVEGRGKHGGGPAASCRRSPWCTAVSRRGHTQRMTMRSLGAGTGPGPGPGPVTGPFISTKVEST